MAGPIAHLIGRTALPGTRALAAPIYVLAGKLWARRGWVPTTASAALAVAVFWMLSIAANGGVMTYGLGLSVFGLVLSLRPGKFLIITARLGRFSLGIYSVHLLLLPFVLPDANVVSSLQAAAKTGLILLAATFVSFFLATLPVLWRLASYQRLRNTGTRSARHAVKGHVE